MKNDRGVTPLEICPVRNEVSNGTLYVGSQRKVLFF